MTRATRHPNRQTTVHIRRSATALLLVGSLGALSGCSDRSPQDNAAGTDSLSPAAPSASAETSASPSAAPGAPLLEAYQKYWDEKVKAYGQASVQGTDLKKYAVAEAFAQAEAEVKTLKAKGLVATGKPVLAPTVTSVDTERKTPQGSLTDCIDISQWKLVEESNGQAVTLPEGRLTKYVTKVVAEKWYGRWVIVKVTPRGQKC